MSKSYSLITCPNCKSTNVRLVDNEPMDSHKNVDGVDSEIYATAECGNCDHSFKIVGQIIWSLT